jgi:hypothetical protein
MTFVSKPRVHHPNLPTNELGLTRRDYEGSVSTLCAGLWPRFRQCRHRAGLRRAVLAATSLCESVRYRLLVQNA